MIRVLVLCVCLAAVVQCFTLYCSPLYLFRYKQFIRPTSLWNLAGDINNNNQIDLIEHDSNTKLSSNILMRNFNIERDNSVTEDVKDALTEQGISWQELLDMREQLLSKNDTKISIKKPRIKLSTETMEKVTSTAHKVSTEEVPQTKIKRLGARSSSSAASTGLNKIALESNSKIKNRFVQNETMKKDTDSIASGKKSKANLDNVKLADMLDGLVQSLGYPALFEETGLRCFSHNPTRSSCLKVLRQSSMEWARHKIQYLYLTSFKK